MEASGGTELRNIAAAVDATECRLGVLQHVAREQGLKTVASELRGLQGQILELRTRLYRLRSEQRAG